MAEEGLSVLPLPFAKTGHKNCPLCTLRKGASLSPRWRTTEKNQNKQLFQVSPSLLPLAYTFCPIRILDDYLSFIKLSIKTLSFNYFFVSSFPYEGSIKLKHYIKLVCFSKKRSILIFRHNQAPTRIEKHFFLS